MLEKVSQMAKIITFKIRQQLEKNGLVTGKGRSA